MRARATAIVGGLVLTFIQLALVWAAARPTPPLHICFSPDGKKLAATAPDWTVRVWDLDSGREPLALPNRMGEVAAIVFSGDSKHIIAAGSDMNLITWDAESGERLEYQSGNTGGVQLRRFSADGSKLASAQNGVLVRDLTGGENLVWPDALDVRALALTGDGGKVAIAARWQGANPSIQVWDLRKQEREVTLDCPDALPLSIAFTPDGRRLAVASGETVLMYDTTEGNETTRFRSEHGPIGTIAIRSDGGGLAAACRERVTVWNDHGDAREIAGQPGRCVGLAYSPPGDRLAGVTARGDVLVWNVGAGVKEREWRREPAPLADFYRKLYRWDTIWYAKLGSEGYNSSNAAFFPSQPLLGRLLHRGLGIAPDPAVVLGSQLAAWGFWTYLILFLRRFGAGKRVAIAAILAVIVHPAAFFLVNGYSEALFLFALLGFLYWEGASARGSWLLAAGHGIVMTGTRIVGFPLVGIPVLRLAVERERTRESILRALILCGLASLGGVLFFAYCQLEFGQWNLYMEVQRTGWGVRADYFAPLHWQTYVPVGLGKSGGDDLSRLSVPLYVALFCLLFLRERQANRLLDDSGWRERFSLYVAAGMMFYISVCGLYHKDMASMIRYAFAVHVMLVLAGAHLASRWKEVPAREARGMLAVVGIAAVASIYLQVRLIYAFTGGSWVA